MLRVHVCKFCKLASEDKDYLERHRLSHRGEEMNSMQRMQEFEKNKALRKLILK
jgi:hypothetical protein